MTQIAHICVFWLVAAPFVFCTNETVAGDVGNRRAWLKIRRDSEIEHLVMLACRE